MGNALGIKRFVHAFGMTETNPMVLRNELDDPPEVQIRPGGRVAPNVEVRIVDPETGVDRDPDVPGEIIVRGDTVTSGYYRDPQAATWRGDWFCTGDLGVRTKDGYYYYLGRLKDMLKIGGFNVSPQEVEELLRSHPAVADVGVTGAADQRLGEVAVAFVKLRPGSSVSEAELKEFCRGQIANFKIPRTIHFVETLPYHAAAHGPKMQRAVLREWAAHRDKVPG